jgi:rhodanese-related sulfurtransferase
MHSITAEALHTLLTSDQEVLLLDIRQPLDLLADSEIIPGATRIPPKELLQNPSLIPKDKDSVVYCTCVPALMIRPVGSSYIELEP